MIASVLAANLAWVGAFRMVLITQPSRARIKLDRRESNRLLSWNCARRHTTLTASIEELKSLSDTTDQVKACHAGDEEAVKKLLADPRANVNGYEVTKNIIFIIVFPYFNSAALSGETRPFFRLVLMNKYNT